MLKKWIAGQRAGITPNIIERNAHTISRNDMSKAALNALYILKGAGFKAYLVGGCVRDLLLGMHPKDFDIVTNAKPEQVKKAFNRCFIIGRRFRLAHVHLSGEVIEVATFRAHGEKKGPFGFGRALYGRIDEDVLRRDFTVNALYYNVEDFSIVDYVGAMEDIKHKRLRMIGDPVTRYQEDPVRIIRAIRFAAKLGFSIDSATEAPISQHKGLLTTVPPARMFIEVVKLFYTGHAQATFSLLEKYGVFSILFPQVAESLKRDKTGVSKELVLQGFFSADKRYAQGKTLSPAFLFALIFWPIFRRECVEKRVYKMRKGRAEAFEKIAKRVFATKRPFSISKRIVDVVKEIWELQDAFHHAEPKDIINHPRFRAAYDLLVLRGKAGESVEYLAEKWAPYYLDSQRAQSRKRSNRRHRRQAPKDAGASRSNSKQKPRKRTRRRSS